VPAAGRQFTLDPVAPGKEVLLARLGAQGPVLCSTTVEAFRVLSSMYTSYDPAGRLADGSTIMVMPISANDLPDGAQIRVQIIVAGVTFEDGSIEKWIDRDDLDENGIYYLRVIHPQSDSFPMCHLLEVWRDGAMVGRR